MAENLRKNPSDAQLASLEYANPPYPLTWIEYEMSFRHGRYNPIDGNRSDDEAPLTKRLGFLMETATEKSLVINMAYSYKDKSLCATLNPLMYFFDSNFSDEMWQEIQKFHNDNFTEEHDDKMMQDRLQLGVYQTIKRDSKKGEFAAKVEKMFMPTCSIYLINTHKKYHLSLNKEDYGFQFNQWLADWTGEALFPLMIFVLLNCRNAVEPKPCESLFVLNKARRVRGKLPLQEYKILELKLSETLKAQAAESEESNRKVRLHWVRGHFKKLTQVKEPGLYWWSPHLAGSKELGMVQKDYAVNV